MKQFFVYLLFRDERIIYVGKGCGRRMISSAREQQATHSQKVFETLVEWKALLVERCLIRLIGLENLQNKSAGGPLAPVGNKSRTGRPHSEETKRKIKESKASKPLEERLLISSKLKQAQNSRDPEEENQRRQKLRDKAISRTSNATVLTFNGQTKRIREWSQETGFTVHTIRNRVQTGWSVERALTTPPDPIKSRPRRKM